MHNKAQHRVRQYTKTNIRYKCSLVFTMYLASIKGSLTAKTSTSSLDAATRKTNLPIRPKPAGCQITLAH